MNEKKKKRGKVKRLLMSAMLITALAGSMAAQASAIDAEKIDLSKKGSITLDLSKMEGGEISIYKVAEAVDDKGFHYDPSKGDFAGNAALTEEAIAALEPQGTEWGKSPNNAKLAETLAQAAGTSETTVPNTNGSVTFPDLVTGLYLIVQTTVSTNGYTFPPFLVTMPDESGNYEVKGTPKPGLQPPSDENIAVKVCKVWDDADNKEGKRPAELTVSLSNGQSVTLNEANKWQATIRNLPKYDKVSGQEIAYTWREGTMPEGYSMASMKMDTEESKETKEDGSQVSVVTEVTTITNTYNPEDVPPGDKTEATVKKFWSDSDNKEKKRPTELKVTLQPAGTEVTLNEENNWTATVKDLPVKDSEGKTIQYTWKEGNMPEGYKLTAVQVCDKDSTITNLTNTYSPEETPKNEDKNEKNSSATTTTNNTTNNTTTNNTTTNNTTTNNSTSNSSVSDSKAVASEKLPQTGQLWWPVPLMAVLGLIFLTLGVKRRKSARL